MDSQTIATPADPARKEHPSAYFPSCAHFMLERSACRVVELVELLECDAIFLQIDLFIPRYCKISVEACDIEETAHWSIISNACNNLRENGCFLI